MNVFNESTVPIWEGSGESREESKARTRHVILRAAREAFEKSGFESSSVRGIAAGAGVSPGSVLHHFGSKRQLLYAAFHADLDEALEAGRKATRAGAAGGGNCFEDRVNRLTETIFAHYQRRPTLSRTLLRESLFAEPPWDARFRAQTAALHQEVASVAADAVAQGELRPEIDVELLAMAWLSFYYFALLAWSQGAHDAPVRLVHRQLVQHLESLRHTPASQEQGKP